MATHDYVIDNQSAPAFRSDLNSALQAIVTQNSNATAPTTTYANMIWYDTANNQLKKRNEANSAWVTLGTIDEATGTFLPNALASQAQAETGTDNTTLVSPLRVSQAIAALAPAPTTATVLAATAGATVGAVGTYALLLLITPVNASQGSTHAGSNLAYANAGGGTALVSPAGTWRLMGYVTNAGGSAATCVFLRIS